ncbi:MAG: cobyrinate a,c-diamide synthase [Leptospirales bacterium]
MREHPGLLVGGVHSGSGKTLVTMALLHGLEERGYLVRPFKCGPDFIDPRFHEWMTGRTSVNLDLFFLGENELASLYDRMIRSLSGGLVEGVMGFYDGAEKRTSTYDVAKILGLPVLLAVHAKGMAETISAVVEGVQKFRDGWNLMGIVGVQTGTPRHTEILARALDREGLPPLLGTLPRHDDFQLPERHLGLVDVRELDEGGKLLKLKKRFSELTADWNWEAICSHFIQVPAAVQSRSEEQGIPGTTFRGTSSSIRLGVAWDSAFRFYYPENWSSLEEKGIQLVPVSPQTDRSLPEDLDGFYLGGGYPEHYAKRLSENSEFIDSVRSFYAAGGLIYAECGGMLYLTHGPENTSGNEPVKSPEEEPDKKPGEQKIDWVGILPFRFHMNGKLKRLGYIEACPVAGDFWKTSSPSIRGHFFHYTELIPLKESHEHFPGPAFTVSGKTEGFQTTNLVASYLHLYFPSSPLFLEQFIEALRQRACSRLFSAPTSELGS